MDCDGGLCRCWDPTHVQLMLLPVAVVAICAISVGFPICIFFLLRWKKNAIKEDQYLRALEIEPLQSTNPVAFFNRLKYHKMYYHFKPGKVYWITFIIARKGLISMAGLVFRANPGFQLAFVLLVLFWAYVMQVKHQPFMSSVERQKVVAEHKAKVEAGDSLHIKLAARIEEAQRHVKEREVRGNQKSAKSWQGAMQKADKKKGERAAKQKKYFWNYNTVEQVLLSCLILVCVGGIMFESDRFQDNHERPETSGFGAWVRFQQDLVTYAVIIIIIGSLFFYFSVATTEITGHTPKCVKKILCLKKKHDLFAKHLEENSNRMSHVVFSENPFAKNFGVGTTAELRSELESERAKAAREREELLSTMYKAKGVMSAERQRMEKRKKKEKRHRSSRRSQRIQARQMEVEMSEISLSGIAEGKEI